jgi:hypothetical protein
MRVSSRPLLALQRASEASASRYDQCRIAAWAGIGYEHDPPELRRVSFVCSPSGGVRIMHHALIDTGLIKEAAKSYSVDEALTHWQLAFNPETGSGGHWVSIAFAAARRDRDTTK